MAIKPGKKRPTKPGNRRTTNISNWDNWPKWTGSEVFQTPNFKFKLSTTDYTGKTSSDEVNFLKDQNFIDIYKRLALNNSFINILEIGFFQGGMPIFLADMIGPKKIVAVDINPATDALQSLVKDKGLSKTIEYIGNVDQNNTELIRNIVETRFDNEPLDLIIDDCSHFYDPTKRCFEQLFGYLRPGGKYVIEDWGWTHWPKEQWQSESSYFHNKTSMTNLIFELVMAAASAEGLISNVEIASGACVVVTRGPFAIHGNQIDLSEIIKVAGGRKAALITSANSESTNSQHARQSVREFIQKNLRGL
jgi:SAM-dependent methyltransferase